jgi:diamine N-acetyltransferase
VDEATPVFTIVGDRVALGPLDRRYLDDYHRWHNDPGLAATAADLSLPGTREEREAWYARAAAGTDPTVVRFTVFDRQTGAPLGLCNLNRVNHHHGTAELGIAIGDASVRGRGYGTEATRLLTRYAFERLGLHNVMLRVYANNPAGIRAYEKAGFREFGRRTGARRYLGQRYDEIHMECVAPG